MYHYESTDLIALHAIALGVTTIPICTAFVIALIHIVRP